MNYLQNHFYSSRGLENIKYRLLEGSSISIRFFSAGDIGRYSGFHFVAHAA